MNPVRLYKTPSIPGRVARDQLQRADQRGFPLVGVPDIGAYEAGTMQNFNAFIWESLPAGATESQHAPAFDFDSSNNNDEWRAGRCRASWRQPGTESAWKAVVQCSGPRNAHHFRHNMKTFLILASCLTLCSCQTPESSTCPRCGMPASKCICKKVTAGVCPHCGKPAKECICKIP